MQPASTRLHFRRMAMRWFRRARTKRCAYGARRPGQRQTCGRRIYEDLAPLLTLCDNGIIANKLDCFTSHGRARLKESTVRSPNAYTWQQGRHGFTLIELLV